MMIRRYSLNLLIALCLYILPCNAEPPNGHIKLQQTYATYSGNSLASSLNKQDTHDTALDFRLNKQYHIDAWSFAADYQLSGSRGSAVKLTNQIKSLFPGFAIEPENSQWLDLDDEITASDNTRLKHRLDRLSVSYSADQLVIRLGRQAISWGNGLVFRPMDLFNPFAPDATDTSYKPGTDMLYGQWLFANGSDISTLIIPRRNPVSNRLDSAQSSYAIKWHDFGQTIQTDIMLASDYRDTIFGISLNGPIAEAVWRIDIVPVFPDQGGSRTSLTTNIEHAFDWGGKNLSAYIEYYRNGFGSTDSDTTLTGLPTELIERIARGQIFNSGRDYLSGGMRIEWTPLLQLNPLLIFNLNDNSALLFAQGSYSLRQNMGFVFGINISIGSKGSEYGGIETSIGSTIYSEVPDQAYARLEHYY